MSNSTPLPQNSQIFLLLLLGVLSAFGPFVVDLYLPSLPQLASFFETSASMTQLTLTTAMLGLAVGQLFLGTLSDKFGRKKPLIISLVLYIVSSVAIVFSPNIETMIALRTIQGLSSAGSVVISRAIVADLYQGQAMTRFFGLLLTINGLAPIFSPIMGSFLLVYTDWRGIFVFLALIGVAVLLACGKLHESLPSDKRLTTSTLASFGVFGNIVKNRLFMAYVSIESLLFGAMFAYIASSPFIFQGIYGLSALGFSLCFGANGTALVLGSNVGGQLTNRKALAVGVLGFGVAVAYTVAMLLTQMGWLWLELGFFAMLFLTGITLPAISALAMDSERKNAGSASALLGFAPFFLGAVVSPLVGVGDIFVASAVVIGLCAILAFLAYWKIRGRIVNL